MRKRIDIGTDIAMIGVWDPTRARHDLKSAAYSEREKALQSEAVAGRLFFVNTSADGGYLTDIYVDEEPDPDYLSVYSAVEREFLLECRSGQLIAGGLEDFIQSTRQITSDQDRFQVAPGRYALRFYELIDDRFSDRLRNHIGADDYAYYESKVASTPWGCCLFAISFVLLSTRLWRVAAGAFAVWAAYLVVRFLILRPVDKRTREIATRMVAFEELFPSFVYVLRRVGETSDIKGGWHNLA